MVEKGIRGGMRQAIYRYVNANNKYMNNYGKNIVWMGTSQKLPAYGFKWINKLFKFNKNFINYYNENSNKGHIIEVDVEHPKNLSNLHKDLPSLAERKLLKNASLYVAIMTKKTMLWK